MTSYCFPGFRVSPGLVGFLGTDFPVGKATYGTLEKYMCDADT